MSGPRAPDDLWAAATHLVVDLETLGTGPRARVVSIGAVKFRLAEGGVQEAETFHRLIDLHSGVNAVREVDQATVAWWDKQPREARFSIDGGPRLSLGLAMAEFAGWAAPEEGDRQGLCAWGYGDEFDLAILSDVCRMLADRADFIDAEPVVALPWAYWRGANLRTLAQCFPHVRPPRRVGVKHNALADAQHEAKYLARLLHERKRWLGMGQCLEDEEEARV